MQFANTQQHLLEDEAHLLNSRGVIQLSGARAPLALQPLISRSLADIEKQPVLAYMLGVSGRLVADLFVVHRQAESAGAEDESGGSLLIDCARSLLPAILEQLVPHCKTCDVIATDVSDDWRVFAELPNQTSTFDDGTPYIKYVDPRWHMGVRILRPRTDLESSQWGHENRWRAHAFKLGMLPSVESVQEVPVSALEANLHFFGLLDPDCVDDGLRNLMASPVEHISRRILPLRIEPNAFSLPTMTGLAVTAGDSPVGTVLAHQGVYGLVLADLDKWREALQAGQSLHCAGQTALITWPTWSAIESLGRAGPAAAMRR